MMSTRTLTLVNFLSENNFDKIPFITATLVYKLKLRKHSIFLNMYSNVKVCRNNHKQLNIPDYIPCVTGI